jgi:hypothetical protein
VYQAIKLNKTSTGRTMTEAVTYWLPASAALVRILVRSCGICSGQIWTGARFLRVFRFPLLISPPTAFCECSSEVLSASVLVKCFVRVF